MTRFRHRVRSPAASALFLVVLLVASTAAVPLAGARTPDAGADARAAAGATGTGAATSPHGGLHIDFTASLTPDRPGEVDVAAGFTVPGGVTSLTAEVPADATVTNIEGFSQRGPHQYEWTRTTDTPSLTYRLPVNETVTRGREGSETSGYLFVDTGAWALMKAPRLGVTYSGTGQRQPIRTDNAVAGQGVAGDSLLYLGPVETTARTVGGQRITLAVPRAADLRESPADVLDALAGTAEGLTFGPADDEVLAIAAPTEGVDYGSTGLQRGASDFWVRDLQRLDTPENVWDHEYVHTRQTYRPTTATRWSYEGMADYYAVRRGLRSGRINYSQYRRHLRIGTRPRYADVVLAEPDTWQGTTAHYWKGALAFAAIDRRIRVETDGRATLQDAIRRAQDRADGGRLDQSTFLGSVEAVGGTGAREVARRYTETDATPETLNRSAYADVFGGVADFDYRFDGFRVEGPYRTTTVGTLPTLVPGERVVVRATATNTGDTAGDYAITLRRGDRAVGTRTGELAAGASTDLSWTVPFDAPAETTLRLGESTRAVTVRPPAAPRVTGLRVPETARVGESVEARAVVTNRAERPANGSVALAADGRTLTGRVVRLAPGESVTLTATTAFEAAGGYTVTAGDRTATVSVRDATATATPAEDGGSTAAGGAATAPTGTDDSGAGSGAGSDGDAGSASGADGDVTTTATPLTPSGASGDGFGVVGTLLAAVLVGLGARRRRN
ncbi:hypothetical protein [Haloglomus litoreum]|uniref:hypothetical protein n=1 Tax=Haloglomus litoreum TaxID=3034026 RepID=UPI0023E7BF50|nr:hypothetical protein [Haloglomus sp. DT116]